jgi:hypothetical protein
VSQLTPTHQVKVLRDIRKNLPQKRVQICLHPVRRKNTKGNNSSKNYTIKIAENDKEGEKLIMQIKELVGDSPFVSIYEEETGLSDDIVRNEGFSLF